MSVDRKGDIGGEDPWWPGELHPQFYAKRSLLVPSDDTVKSILDGGEMVYAKVCVTSRELFL